MITRRVWINLAAFTLLFAVLCVWAVRNVVHLDLIERPYRITASFERSPGLRPNVEVTYHGVQVGKVDGVRLRAGQVDVALDIERDVRLPADLTAAVRRKSAVGEPYVALEPPAGYAGGGPYVARDGSASIDVADTTVPLAYGELFASVDALVRAVPSDDLATVLDELATALGGRGRDLRALVQGASSATRTLAEESATLDDLAGDLTTLASAIADHRGALGRGVDDVAALTQALAAAGDDIDALLASAPDLGQRVAALLHGSGADLGCAFADAGELFAAVGTPEQVDQLVRLLRSAGYARDALDAALVAPGEEGADGPYLGGSFVPDVDQPGTPYATRPTLPEPPTLEPCTEPGTTPRPAADDAAVAGPGAGGRAAVAPEPGRADDQAAAPDRERSTERPVPTDRFPWSAVAVVAVLGTLVVVFAVTRPWRRLGTGRADGGEDAGGGP